MRVEFLYWEECPSHEEALRRLQEALQEEGVSAPVASIRVTSLEQASELRFPGSPTIRLNGRDLQPDMLGQLPVGLTCRVYRVDGRPSPLPTKAMIRDAIRRALREEKADGQPATG